jgi:hypothetical protein
MINDPALEALASVKQDKIVVAGLVRKSNRILASIRTHKFPLDFFPDTITLEEGRINVIVRNFFFSSQVYSVDLKNIANVIINTAPLFAQLVVVSKTFTENEIHINNLWINDAIYVRRLIEGLRVLDSKQIDTSVYTKRDLIGKLEDLSSTDIVI